MEPRCLSFSRNAEAALRDRALQTALSRTTARFLENRAAAVEEFPGFEGARERASRTRDESLARLPELLSRFVGEAEARGAVVHVAEDDRAAREIAVRIAREEGVTRAVKSKSMAAEEVGLAPALASAGIEVSETDLGEYILQLAGEHPSHLVAPAIHKTREQVADLFAEKLSVPRTEEIPELARTARRHLREKFLSAHMGITGANFLVAETGSVVLVTNEGNGRLGTALPRVHLVLAGIEKTIPRLSDLPDLLRVLPRSATGQAISTYVSILTGTRRPGATHGPERLHIVLVDNGRSAILEGKYREILKCIRCGACLNVCPVFQSVGGHAYGWVYPGPVGSVLSPLLLGLPRAHPLPDASTLCGACEPVCPVRIPLPGMLASLRADKRDQGLVPPAVVAAAKAYAATASRGGLLEALQRTAGALAEVFRKDRKIPWLPRPLSGWTDRRDFPAPAPRPFRKLWKQKRGVRP